MTVESAGRAQLAFVSRDMAEKERQLHGMAGEAGR